MSNASGIQVRPRSLCLSPVDSVSPDSVSPDSVPLQFLVLLLNRTPSTANTTTRQDGFSSLLNTISAATDRAEDKTDRRTRHQELYGA